MKRSSSLENIFFVCCLLFLWALYYCFRAAITYELISDEAFYVYTQISDENKRVLFLKLVQLFQFNDFWRFCLLFINAILLVSCFFCFKNLYFNNGFVAFIQLIYMAGVGVYIFRDLYLLLFVSLFSVVYLKIKRNNNINRFFAYLILLTIVAFLADFRPHFVVFLVLSMAAAIFFGRIQSLRVSIIWFVTLGLIFLGSLSIILDNVYLRNMPAREFLSMLSEKRGFDYSPASIAISFIKHYLTPLPSSLIERILYSDLHSSYGVIDDIYRVVYKLGVYCAVVVCFINFRKSIFVIGRRKKEFFFLFTFSMLNALTYVLFNPEGGHERVKVMSTLFIFYLFSGVVYKGWLCDEKNSIRT